MVRELGGSNDEWEAYWQQRRDWCYRFYGRWPVPSLREKVA